MFNLIDYKRKYYIIQDQDRTDDEDFVVGTITKKEAIEEAPERIEACDYYGIPPYIGTDPDLLKIYK